MTVEQIPTFGAQLRRFREAAGLSQEDLAERAGLSVKAISALERGERLRPYPRTVQLLAEALNLDDQSRAVLISAVPKRGPAPDASNVEAGHGVPTNEPRVDDTNSDSQPADDRRSPVASAPRVAEGRGVSGFVGRQGELAALREKLAAAFAGQGDIVVITGEAGIGKTSLAYEFADYAASQGAAVLWGCCFEGDWQPPYGPWVEALGAYVRARSSEDVRRDFGAGVAPIAQLVPEIRAVAPEVPAPSPLSPDEERFRLYDAVARFLLGIAGRQPVLLVLDDLHWADHDSLRLLRHMSRFVKRARVMVVGAYRDPEFGLNDAHPLIGTLSVLRREVDYKHIAIRGFGRDEMADYLAHAAGQPFPQALTRVIEEETNGNPFYAREVFRHLTEEAKLLHRGGRWTTDLSIGELGIPDGVRQVVGRRVARLSEQTGNLLRLAAGFNAGFGFDAAKALTGLTEHMLLDCLDEALQAGLIRTSVKSPPRYEFAHAIVRHTLYDGMNLDRRARLHRRIALALEQSGAGGESEDAEIAAQYHASAALPGASAGVPHALRAAGRAKAVHSHERAAGFLRVARDLAGESPPGEKADILRQLAIAEADAAELEHAKNSVKEALEAMSAAGVDPRARAGFLVTVAQTLKDAGAVATVWEPLVEQGLAFTGGKRDLLWARLTLLKDNFELIQSGPIGGSRWLGHDPEAIAIVRSQGDEEDYARTLDPLDCRTREETKAILALARSWSRPSAIMRALEVAGRDMMYRHGAFLEAAAIYEELLAVSERFGAIPNQGEALTHLATIQMYEGNLARSKEILSQAHEVIGHLGAAHRLHRFVGLSRAVVLAYFLDGEWVALAKEMTDYATSAAAWRSSAGVAAAALAALSVVRAGNESEARSLLEHVTSVVSRVDPSTYAQSVAVAVAATAVWELEATEFAAAYRRLTLDLIEAGAGGTGFGPLELWVARMSALLGDFDEAQDYFEMARSKLDGQGPSHLNAIVIYDQACCLIRSGAGDKARIVELFDEALERFRSHGMLGWARRATEKKEALTVDA